MYVFIYIRIMHTSTHCTHTHTHTHTHKHTHTHTLQQVARQDLIAERAVLCADLLPIVDAMPLSFRGPSSIQADPAQVPKPQTLNPEP